MNKNYKSFDQKDCKCRFLIIFNTRTGTQTDHVWCDHRHAVASTRVTAAATNALRTNCHYEYHRDER